MEPRPDRYEDWHERCQAEIRMLVWSQPSVKHSFYKNSDGEIHALSPWRLVDYWSWTKEPDLADFRSGGRGAAGSRRLSGVTAKAGPHFAWSPPSTRLLERGMTGCRLPHEPFNHIR